MSFSVFVAAVAVAMIAIEGILYWKTRRPIYLALGIFVFVTNLPNFISLMVT